VMNQAMPWKGTVLVTRKAWTWPLSLELYVERLASSHLRSSPGMKIVVVGSRREYRR